MHQRSHFGLALIGAGFVAGAARGEGPGCPYFLTAPDDGLLVRVKHSNSHTDPMNLPGETVIAVAGTLRTAGEAPGGMGSEYDFDLTFLGREFSLGAPEGLFSDGATDGQFFYSIDFSTGDVYRFKKNWKNGEFLWSAPGSGTWAGITYDHSNDSFWIARWDNGRVENYTRDGEFLSRFNVGHDTITSLGLHFETGLLWMGDGDDPGVYEGYDREGNLVDSVDYGFTFPTMGGEFDLGAVAKIRSFNVRRGAHIEGGNGTLKVADNDRMKIDAETLPNDSQRMELEVRLRTNLDPADAERMDLVVEHKISVSGGETRLFLKNWTSGNFDVVHTEAIGTAEQFNSAENLLPSKYIRDDGLIIARIRHSVADPPAGTVRSQIDLVQVNVRD